MEEQLVSSYRASQLLRRDRQTVERALRTLVPDRIDDRGRRYWYLSRIADAVAKGPQARREVGRYRDRYRIIDQALDRLLAAFEANVALIAAEPSSERRRELALELAPSLAEFQAQYLATGRALHVDDHALGARADLVWNELMSEVSDAAGWPRDDGFFTAMFQAQWPDADRDA